MQVKGFKFLTEREWGKLEYRSGASDVVLKSGIKYKLYASKGASEDGKFKVSESANYEIICDLARKTIEVKKVAYQAKEIRYAALWMIGDATAGDWDYNNGVLLSQDSGNPTCYTATVELKEGEFKFTTISSGDMIIVCISSVMSMTKIRLFLVEKIISGE